jgi:autophagy-related protein 2
VDLHDLVVSGREANHGKRQAHFADPSSPRHNESTLVTKPLASAQWGRIMIAYSLTGERQATGIASFGPITSFSEDVSHERRTGSIDEATYVAPDPRFTLPTIDMSQLLANDNPTALKTVISVHIPSVSSILQKPILDGLQLWADDASQLIERSLGGGSSTSISAKSSRDPSIIGSRYFTHPGTESRSTSGSELEANAGQPGQQSETVVKVVVSEGVSIHRHASHINLILSRFCAPIGPS